MPPKRKASDIEYSDSDEEPALGRQVLPVANLPHDFSGEPTDGLQYLFTVRRDARLLPHYTRVENPYDVKQEPVEVPATVPGTSTPHLALPSEEWREIFLQRFRNFRRNTAQPTIHVRIPMTSVKVMPEKKQRDQWWAFIEGEPQEEWDPPKKPKQPKQNGWHSDRFGGGLRGYSDGASRGEVLNNDPEASLTYEEQAAVPEASGSLPTPSSTPAPETPAVVQAEDLARLAVHSRREPTPSLLQHIDHRYALHLLMYFTHWINVHFERSDSPALYFTHTHARWIFVLLSRVDDYVSADETSLLRSLARACILLIKDHLTRRPALASGAASPASRIDTAMDERSCWLIITAVTGIWGQRDLWMDAEEMLSKTVQG